MGKAKEGGRKGGLPGLVLKGQRPRPGPAPPRLPARPERAVGAALPALPGRGCGGTGTAAGPSWAELGRGGAAEQRVHFAGNQRQAAIFGECCPFN